MYTLKKFILFIKAEAVRQDSESYCNAQSSHLY